MTTYVPLLGTLFKWFFNLSGSIICYPPPHPIHFLLRSEAPQLQTVQPIATSILTQNACSPSPQALTFLKIDQQIHPRPLCSRGPYLHVCELGPLQCPVPKRGAGGEVPELERKPPRRHDHDTWLSQLPVKWVFFFLTNCFQWQSIHAHGLKIYMHPKKRVCNRKEVFLLSQMFLGLYSLLTVSCISFQEFFKHTQAQI